MAEKKDKRNPEHSGAFIVASILLVGIIFGILKIKYNTAFIENIITPSETYKTFFKNSGIYAAILVCIYGLLIFISMIFREPLNAVGKISSVALIGGISLFLTMAAINFLPLLHRTFENTIGYWWIKGDELKSLTTNEIFKNTNYGDLSVISTQVNVENFKSIDDKVNGPLSRFQGITLKEGIKISSDKEKPMYKFLEKIVDKRHVSETVWLSLASILTMYGAYLIGEP